MDLLLIVDQVLMVLVLLALCIALRRASQSFMAIALTAGLVGIAAYFASTTAFEMLSLSDQYAAATTEAQRSMCRGTVSELSNEQARRNRCSDSGTAPQREVDNANWHDAIRS
jgi:hypothetical protein